MPVIKYFHSLEIVSFHFFGLTSFDQRDDSKTKKRENCWCEGIGGKLVYSWVLWVPLLLSWVFCGFHCYSRRLHCGFSARLPRSQATAALARETLACIPRSDRHCNAMLCDLPRYSHTLSLYHTDCNAMIYHDTHTL